MVAYQIPKVVEWRACEVSEPWMELHRQLLSVAKRRAALDSEELALIREAIRVSLWRRLGMVSMREYLEHAMGYGPQVASERLRVAETLDTLPAIEHALATGELSYSAVRELTRIATPKTEEVWLAACEGKNLREIEELVAEREPGDAPTDDPKPDVRPQRVSMALRPAARAALRSARQAIEAVRGERIDDSELIEELCRGYGVASDEAPRAQIAITTCDTCKQARKHAAGRAIAISDAEWQSRGGGHTMENLTTLCGGHHAAVHRGQIMITGQAPRLVVTRAFAVPHVGELGESHVGESAPLARDAVLALTTLGFGKQEARRAVEQALRDKPTSLEELVRAALRECR